MLKEIIQTLGNLSPSPDPEQGQSSNLNISSQLIDRHLIVNHNNTLFLYLLGEYLREAIDC